MRPLIVFLSQLDFDQMQYLLYESEQADVFLAKPLSMKKLEHLLRIVKFI